MGFDLLIRTHFFLTDLNFVFCFYQSSYLDSMKRSVFYVLIIFYLSCISPKQAGQQSSPSLALPFRPNILWLVAEDLSPVIPPFGDSSCTTPALSRLAKEGIRYPNTFSCAGVCAPSRASLAMGMYQTRIGAQDMRTGPWMVGTPSKQMIDGQRSAFPEGMEYYEAVPPAGAHMHSEYMRMAGYYCTNRFKQDYQFIAPVTAWDDCSPTAHWRGRKPGQPFFSIFNFEVCHESQIWEKAKDSLWLKDDALVTVPPYLPSTPTAMRDIRRMYSNVMEMDSQVGKILDKLEQDGLLDSTIVFWYSDHGGPLPRQKRLCYDSGLRVPLIIRFPNKWRQGQIDSQLISFVDFLPSIVSIAGVKPPDGIDGRSFLGSYTNSTQRKYIHGAADRFDERYDMIRAVRDRQYKYLRNFYPEKPYYLPVAYREKMPIMQEMLRLHKSGALNPAQEQWFRSKKDPEELFDTYTDLFELHNLASDPAYANKLTELRNECDRWMKDTQDKGLMNEKEMVHMMWGGDKQPVTQDPTISSAANLTQIQSSTPGASIGYKIIHDSHEPKSWVIYQSPFAMLPGDKIKAIAHRIGYAPSRILEFPN